MLPSGEAGRYDGRVQGSHVRRKAIVYVRQSTPGQVVRHRESTALQYGLTDRAAQLGWAQVNTEVIDEDLGQSAKQAGTRPGFLTLVAEVGLGRVGIVISSEVSRLARNLSEWGRLLELCDLTDTLIADAESLYDLRRPNDRFLLGIKGTVSEAELHTLRQRMHAGREAKAARGELGGALPRGYVRDPAGRVVLDPDASVQARIRGIFRTFARYGSLSATLRSLAADGQGLPVRRAQSSSRGELTWPPPSSATLYQLLTSPVYAGAFAWGRVAGADRKGTIEGRWRHLLKDQHAAYITWEEFEFNQHQLARNRWPVRGLGGGLLSGLVHCVRGGQGMTVSYRDSGGDGLRYTCRGRRDYGGAVCQSLSSRPLERFAGEVVVQALSPASVELSLEALRQAEADRSAEHEVWRLRLARAEQDVAAAHRAWRMVDPGNRLVAQTLEDAWEAALAEQERLRDAYRRFGEHTPQALSARERAAITEATSGVADLWQDGRMTKAEQAEILRLMMERVVVTVVDDSERVGIEVHWHGGARTRTEIRRPVRTLEQLSYYEDLRAQIAAWRAEGRSCRAIAALLNASDWTPARHDRFTEASVSAMVQRSGLARVSPPRLPRPSPAGQGRDEWLVNELAGATGVSGSTLHGWIQKGRLDARKEPPPDDGKRRRWLIRADRTTCNAIRAWRARSRGDKTRRRIPDFRTVPTAG